MSYGIVQDTSRCYLGKLSIVNSDHGDNLYFHRLDYVESNIIYNYTPLKICDRKGTGIMIALLLTLLKQMSFHKHFSPPTVSPQN